MRAIPFLAALLCTAPLAGAKTELELLQDRCAEMERQIRALETENSQLKSQVATSAKTVVETAPEKTEAAPAEASKEDAAAPAPAPAPATPSFAIVRAGDSLAKVAKRHGTSAATLIKLNQIKNPSLIRAGQKLRLPDKAPAIATKAAATPAHGTHVVKSGETFFSIARHYGLSVEALQAANPAVKAGSLRPGQTLHLGTKPAPVATKSTSGLASPASKAPANEAPAAETGSETVSNTPRVRLVAVTDETDFGAFAAAHGTSTAKLNALNGHNLNPSTVLAKGSELYVPAQP